MEKRHGGLLWDLARSKGRQKKKGNKAGRKKHGGEQSINGEEKGGWTNWEAVRMRAKDRTQSGKRHRGLMCHLY